MWCCDWCCSWWIDQPSERTPLMHGQRVPAGGFIPEANSGTRSNVTIPQKTVRDGLFPAHMKLVKVASVDKRFQDHAKLFNIHLELWNRLTEKENELRRMFPVENPKFTLRGALSNLRDMYGKYSSFSVMRPYAYCLEINYDGHEIPPQIIPAFISFNLANRTVKEIIDKGPSLAQSVRLVLSSSNELGREVRVTSLGSDMRNSLDNFSENLEVLEDILKRVEEIEKRTKGVFEEFLTILPDLHNMSV